MTGPPESRIRSIGVVIPCYRVRDAVLDVIARIGSGVSRIYCVDDACAEMAGDHAVSLCTPATSVRSLIETGNPPSQSGSFAANGYRSAIRRFA